MLLSLFSEKKTEARSMLFPAITPTPAPATHAPNTHSPGSPYFIGGRKYSRPVAIISVILEKDPCWKGQGRGFPVIEEGRKEPRSEAAESQHLRELRLVSLNSYPREVVTRRERAMVPPEKDIPALCLWPVRRDTLVRAVTCEQAGSRRQPLPCSQGCSRVSGMGLLQLHEGHPSSETDGSSRCLDEGLAAFFRIARCSSGLWFFNTTPKRGGIKQHPCIMFTVL